MLILKLTLRRFKYGERNLFRSNWISKCIRNLKKGSSEISEVSISSIKDAKNEIILESIVELEK